MRKDNELHLADLISSVCRAPKIGEGHWDHSTLFLLHAVETLFFLTGEHRWTKFKKELFYLIAEILHCGSIYESFSRLSS
jgi:hypothetical protein